MTTRQEFVAGRWQLIESLPAARDTQWKSLNIPVQADGRWLAQAVDELGRHHLLVPADAGRHSENRRSPLAVSLGEYQFQVGSEDPVDGRYMDIHCQVPGLNRQFDTVIGDVIDAVEDSNNPVAAATAAVANWRRLFASLVDHRPLNFREKLAAFGELSVLLELMEVDTHFRCIWWTGPKRAPHDFELPHWSLEVKTMGEDSATITVHGFSQLVAETPKRMALVVRKVVESEDGQTLAELLEEVLAVCDDPMTVRERAALLGVHEAMNDSTRFEVVDTASGEVEEGFPRIVDAAVGASAAEAVRNLTYDLEFTRIRTHLNHGSVVETIGPL